MQLQESLDTDNVIKPDGMDTSLFPLSLQIFSFCVKPASSFRKTIDPLHFFCNLVRAANFQGGTPSMEYSQLSHSVMLSK